MSCILEVNQLWASYSLCLASLCLEANCKSEVVLQVQTGCYEALQDDCHPQGLKGCHLHGVDWASTASPDRRSLEQRCSEIGKGCALGQDLSIVHLTSICF
eukprot:1161379-Pelagomonas_calceolata.AAC.6